MRHADDVGADVSPAGWTAPPGSMPGWNWIPPGYGLRPLLPALPRWVRVWYRTPVADRWAHVWMWHHGGWLLTPHVDGGEASGVREPRRPVPPARDAAG
jgi:hypothetical protein